MIELSKLEISDGDTLVLKGDFEVNHLIAFRDLFRSIGHKKSAIIALGADQEISDVITEKRMNEMGWYRKK
jgi:hypothetical protein